MPDKNTFARRSLVPYFVDAIVVSVHDFLWNCCAYLLVSSTIAALLFKKKKKKRGVSITVQNSLCTPEFPENRIFVPLYEKSIETHSHFSDRWQWLIILLKFNIIQIWKFRSMRNQYSFALFSTKVWYNILLSIPFTSHSNSLRDKNLGGSRNAI